MQVKILVKPLQSPPIPVARGLNEQGLIGITYYRVRAPLTPLLVMSCITMHMLALYLLFLPPLLSLDTETDAAATQYDYGVDDPLSCQSNQASPPPLITRYHLLSSILLALE